MLNIRKPDAIESNNSTQTLNHLAYRIQVNCNPFNAESALHGFHITHVVL